MASKVNDWSEFGICSPPDSGSNRSFLVEKQKNLMTNRGATPTIQVEEEPCAPLTPISSIHDTERTRSKLPRRVLPASPYENMLPARQVAPVRRVLDFTSQHTSPFSYASSGSSTGDCESFSESDAIPISCFTKRLSNGASNALKRQLSDDSMWSDDEADFFSKKTSGYDNLSCIKNQRYLLAIYLAFLAAFAILITSCVAYFKFAEWIVTIGVITIVAYSFYCAVQWRLAEKQMFPEDVMSAFENFVEMMKSWKFMKTEQAVDELVAAGFSVDVITAVLKKASSDLRFDLYKRDDVTGYLCAVKGESSDKPRKFLRTSGGVGGLFVAPSSCLKIRGMFDPSSQIMNSQERERIVDAILEECTGDKLVHVAVDPRSFLGVVYARGLHGVDAANVFRKINGSIFEGRRVIVKFIHPTRYNEKFPRSASLTRPLYSWTRSY